MAIRSAILADVDLRYRNSFTQAQKLVWINEEERELFETITLDSTPYEITIDADQQFYPIPDSIAIERIKVVTAQVNTQCPPTFNEVPYQRNDDRQFVSLTDTWYTIVDNSFFFNIPGEMNDRTIYVYYDKEPTEWTTDNLTFEPDTPKTYQEFLKLGLLKRICMARKDIPMVNNYKVEYDEKMVELEWRMRNAEPEFVSAIDTMPRSPSLYPTGMLWAALPSQQ